MSHIWMCLTWSADSHTWMSTTCTGSEPYTVTWSTHLLSEPAPVPVQLTVIKVLPTANSYARPSEPISFQLNTSTAEAVIYLIDFDDARSTQTLNTTDQVVAHAWASAGNYTVNVTAVTRTNKETELLQIYIDDTEEGVAPQNLTIKVDVDRNATASDHSVTAFIQAYSPKTCTVYYGDGTSSADRLTDPIFSEESAHQYPGLGFYTANLRCSNSFGASSKTAVAVGAQRGLRYENVAKGHDLALPVAGADGSVGNAVVFVDNAKASVGIVVNGTHVTVGRALLADAGEHAVTLETAEGLALLRAIVTVETPISGVQLRPDNNATVVGQPVEFVATVMHGDNLFVNLSYGDGDFELVYVPSSPVTLTRRHLYSSLSSRRQ